MFGSFFTVVFETAYFIFTLYHKEAYRKIMRDGEEKVMCLK